MARTVRRLRSQNLRQIAINVHYLPAAIRAALGDGTTFEVSLHYSDEPTLLGTAGGVGELREFFDTTFVVLYGDNYYDFDLTPIVARHRAFGALGTIATFTTPNPTACGLIETAADGRVTRFVEKPLPDRVFTDQANAGVYVLEPEIFRYIPDTIESDFGHDVFPKILETFPGSLWATPLNGYLRDTGTPENYRQANWDAVTLHGEKAISESAEIASGATLSGRNVVGAGCAIETGAVLSESILWDGVTVGRGATVRGAILGHGVTIGAAAVVGEGSLLADGARVPEGARVPPGTRLEPGQVASA